MITELTKRWAVHLATPAVHGSFRHFVTARSEADAVSKALRQYPGCYVIYTEEIAT